MHCPFLCVDLFCCIRKWNTCKFLSAQLLLAIQLTFPVGGLVLAKGSSCNTQVLLFSILLVSFLNILLSCKWPVLVGFYTYPTNISYGGASNCWAEVKSKTVPMSAFQRFARARASQSNSGTKLLAVRVSILCIHWVWWLVEGCHSLSTTT